MKVFLYPTSNVTLAKMLSILKLGETNPPLAVLSTPVSEDGELAKALRMFNLSLEDITIGVVDNRAFNSGNMTPVIICYKGEQTPLFREKVLSEIFKEEKGIKECLCLIQVEE